MGSTRFAPFEAVDSGGAVPTMYLASSEAAALLEVVFHEVHHRSSRYVYERDLRKRALAYLLVPRDLWLADLRDPELDRHGIRREQVVSSPAEHYPCTRRLARQLHAREIGGRRVDGMLWNSRQAELLDGPEVEVCVVFGDGLDSGRGSWALTGPGVRNLFEGPGRLLVDAVAAELDAVVLSAP